MARMSRRQRGRDAMLAACPQCGALASAGARWCGACGAVLSAPPASPVTALPLTPAARRGSPAVAPRSFGAVELVLLAAALVCAVVGILLLVAG